MDLMDPNFATLNARELRHPSKYARLLGKLLNLSIDVAALQETYFTCFVDCQVLEDDYVTLSAYGSIGVSLLIGCSLNAAVNLVLVKSFKFQVAAVYVPNITAERVFFCFGG